MLNILDRYVLREIFLTWVGVTGVLLIILLSNKFSGFLGDVAVGRLPKDAIFSLVGYSSIYYLLILAPIGLFLAILLSVGRLYQDSEMSAMKACGIGPWQLYRPIFLLAAILSASLYWLSMEASPWAARQTLDVQNTARAQVQISNLEPGKFLTADEGRLVFYANQKNAQGQLEQVFLQQAELNTESDIEADDAQRGQQLVTANTGYHQSVNESGQKLFILKNGTRFQGIPGRTDYEVINFAEHGIPFVLNVKKNKAAGPEEMTAAQIRDQTSLDFRAELQWRWSVPISALLLAFLALPLSKTNPRQGRFGKVAIAILLYIVYVNLMALSKAWIVKEQIDPLIGLWWVHLLILSLTVVLLLQQYGLRGLFFKPKSMALKV